MPSLFKRAFGIFAVFLMASTAAAQVVVVDVAQVQSWLSGTKKFVLVDVRTPDEYREAHIPQAVNIQADRIAVERSRLPKDKSMPLMFYCRGVG